MQKMEKEEAIYYVEKQMKKIAGHVRTHMLQGKSFRQAMAGTMDQQTSIINFLKEYNLYE